MYRVSLRGVEVCDPLSPWHGKVLDMTICPDSISLGIESQQVYQASGLKISPGWVDLRSALMQPGYEQKDTLQHLCHSAAAGGFTRICVFGNDNFPLDSPEDVAFVAGISHYGVRLHPFAALSQSQAGIEMTEMLMLKEAGAIGFSDGQRPAVSVSLLNKALTYGRMVDGLIANLALDMRIAPHGLMHEGAVSVGLGLPGIPSVSEQLALNQQITLLEYTEGKLHLHCIGTAAGLALLRQCKSRLRLSCDAAAYQFFFCDEDLVDFDTHLKTLPPLRSAADRQALWEALADGTLDAVCSDHTPQDLESKRLEFDLAAFGMLGLETFFGSLNTLRPEFVTLDMLLQKFTTAPRKILGLAQPQVAVGAVPELTLFDENLLWQVAPQHLKSKSSNSPFIGKTLKGKALAIFTEKDCYLSEDLAGRKL